MEHEKHFEDKIKELEEKIDRASFILSKMRAASECDFSEMPYWSNEVLKQLGKE
jgi:hypothetical protein